MNFTTFCHFSHDWVHIFENGFQFCVQWVKTVHLIPINPIFRKKIDPPKGPPKKFRGPLWGSNFLWSKYGVDGYQMNCLDPLNAELKTIFKNRHPVIRKMQKVVKMAHFIKIAIFRRFFGLFSWLGAYFWKWFSVLRSEGQDGSFDTHQPHIWAKKNFDLRRGLKI